MQHLIDGTCFMRSFFKLVRLQERVLMGTMDNSSVNILLFSKNNKTDAEAPAPSPVKTISVTKKTEKVSMMHELFDGVNPWTDLGIGAQAYEALRSPVEKKSRRPRTQSSPLSRQSDAASITASICTDMSTFPSLNDKPFAMVDNSGCMTPHHGRSATSTHNSRRGSGSGSRRTASLNNAKMEHLTLPVRAATAAVMERSNMYLEPIPSSPISTTSLVSGESHSPPPNGSNSNTAAVKLPSLQASQ